MNLHQPACKRVPPSGPADPHRPDRRRQVRRHVPLPGRTHPRVSRGGHRRSVAATGARFLAAHRLAGGTGRCREHRRGPGPGHDLDHRRRRGAVRRRCDRGRHRCHRPPRRRHPPCAPGLCPRQAHRYGERGGRRPGRAFAGRGSGAGRCGLQPCLWRPAGADLRDGRLGAHLRASRGRRRQGHQVPAVLPQPHARRRLGALRHFPGRTRRAAA